MYKGLTAQHSKALHGIAVMMMLFHHLFYPERLAFPYHSLIDDILGSGAEEGIAAFLKICVAIFAFTSGYGMNRKCAADEENEGLRLSFRSFVSIMRKYLIVFVIFIPLACVLADYGKIFTTGTFLRSLLGWDASFNDAWWYLRFYISVLIAFPLMQASLKMMEKCTAAFRVSHLVSAAVASFAFIYIMAKLDSERPYTVIFLEGYLCAEFHLFEFLFSRQDGRKREKRGAAGRVISVLFWLALLAAVCACRVILEKYRGYGFADSIMIVPLTAVLTELLESLKTVNHFFQWMGGYSTYMWLTHIFFAYTIFQKYVLAIRIDVVMYCLLLAVSLLTAMALTWIEKWLLKFTGVAYGKILERNIKKS